MQERRFESRTTAHKAAVKLRAEKSDRLVLACSRSARCWPRSWRPNGREPRRPLGSSDSGCGIPSADMADSPLLFDSSNLPKDHQAARKDAIEKMEAIVSELMKVKDQDAADVVRRDAKALKRPLLVVLPDKDGKFLHGGVKTPPGSDKG